MSLCTVHEDAPEGRGRHGAEFWIALRGSLSTEDAEGDLDDSSSSVWLSGTGCLPTRDGRRAGVTVRHALLFPQISDGIGDVGSATSGRESKGYRSDDSALGQSTTTPFDWLTRNSRPIRRSR